MGSLQGAELQQGLKPVNLFKVSLGRQRGWVAGSARSRMGTARLSAGFRQQERGQGCRG